MAEKEYFFGVKYELEISNAIREIAVKLTQIRSSVILQNVVRKELKNKKITKKSIKKGGIERDKKIEIREVSHWMCLKWIEG
ncbi:Uncharacterized protein HZ326_2305 [Fusarium oxysporum f. sp. albedinis]|nr:Uncharacterized protein HZ326_2305 [Fusarium oxysporum f. sp. albedinis]